MNNETFLMPERTTTDAGRERRVGVEIEYTGVTLAETAQLIHELYGGRIESAHRFKFTVKDSLLGDFEIDSDSNFVSKRKWEKYLESFGIDFRHDGLGKKLNRTIEEVVAAIGEVAPFEIGSPPIPFSKLYLIERLRAELHAAGAKGTHAHFFSAFGLQFNPEMPDLRLETLLGYMRAFFLSYDSLLASEDIPLARRVLPFIDPFPVEFVRQVLDPDYAPTLNGFMRDYLEVNPTRNRVIDWLPLFAYLDKDLVFEYPVEKDLIKPRPTLHYRLPSSLIDDPSWTIASEWNKWVAVDNLANHPDDIHSMSEEFLRQPIAKSSTFASFMEHS